jgi:hypothetical protein
LLNHIRGGIPLNTARDFGELCMAAVESSPGTTIQSMIELCYEHILEELEYGAGSRGNSERSDARLHWYQILLSNVLAKAGAYVLPHRAKLMMLFRKMAENCRSKHSIMLFAEILRSIVATMTKNWTSDLRSENAAIRNSQSKSAHMYGSVGCANTSILLLATNNNVYIK